MRAAVLAALIGLGACGDVSQSSDPPPSSVPPPVYLSLDAAPSQASVQVTVVAIANATVVLTVNAALVLVMRAPGLTLTLDGAATSELGFQGPHGLTAGEHELSVGGPAGTYELNVQVLGPKVSAVEEARSLVWRDPAVLDAPELIGLGRLLATVAADGHGGRLFAAWLRRFGTTAHSERAGPVLFLESLLADHGADPSAWSLDELPFVVTAVHSRLDLRTESHCGEFRVSMASVDAAHQPFHLIFRFRQRPLPADVSPAGVLHCAATAMRWAALSALSESEFQTAAAALLDVTLTPESFINAESVEFIISPWEWRQWDLVPNPDLATASQLPFVFDNPPLFQTVDATGLNQPGPARDAFLAFVEANAPALAARTLAIPAQFRAPSARVNAGVPWVPLDLTGVAPAVLEANPFLRQKIEIVGCPACHATDAEFVQTRADRTFSPFYKKELLARATDLLARLSGDGLAHPFGPLQENPVLPP